MSLSELIAGVEAHEQTLTVYNAGAAASDELRAQFADRNIRVETERTESGRPDEFVTLSDDGEVVTATSLASFRDELSSMDSTDGSDNPYRSLLDHLDETMFTSWSIDRLVAASREIEDRAWRVGTGALHAGFQTTSTLKGELDLYTRLGETDVDVHAYAYPDTDPPDQDRFTLHLERSSEIAESWFVVFDGGGDDEQKSALLAEEREPRAFYGFWTYDPTTVDYILRHLESTYGFVEQ
ncbi:DICT sensory domain-containing protein [Halomicroarcula sp. GCM10025324]|jgi:DICT domain-containing protein|uniref:DICT sensory domain-containing protein n=1 Tax=Haloarcula TaxID=2237 RepID=UPI0023E818B9|nr:DICT sensory domain-containing protein [Halomicroarcula sp. ZS-22-S1]